MVLREEVTDKPSESEGDCYRPLCCEYWEGRRMRKVTGPSVQLKGTQQHEPARQHDG